MSVPGIMWATRARLAGRQAQMMAIWHSIADQWIRGSNWTVIFVGWFHVWRWKGGDTYRLGLSRGCFGLELPLGRFRWPLIFK